MQRLRHFLNGKRSEKDSHTRWSAASFFHRDQRRFAASFFHRDQRRFAASFFRRDQRRFTASFFRRDQRRFAAPFFRRDQRRYAAPSFVLFPLLLLSSLLMLFSPLLPGVAVASGAAGPGLPEAKNGKIDLSDFDFTHGDLIPLNGEWQFYPGELLTPEQLLDRRGPAPIPITVPGTFSKSIHNGTPLLDQGYGTYRLILTLSEEEAAKEKGLYLPPIATAYRLYIDGSERVSSGIVGKSIRGMTPYDPPRTLSFMPQGRQVEILLQVSNFVQRKGGLWESIRLGEEGAVQFERVKNAAKQAFVFGGMISMAFYHFMIYLLNRKAWEHLFISLFSLAIFLRTVVLGENLLSFLLPFLPWELLVHVEYSSVEVATASFLLYAYTQYRQEMNRKLLTVLLAIQGLEFCFIWLTPARIYTQFLIPLAADTLLVFLYLLFVFLLASIRRREGTTLNAIGLAILFAAILTDSLYYTAILPIGEITPFGILIYLILQSYHLGKKTADAHRRAEQMAENLSALNLTLEERIQLRTERLNELNSQLEVTNRELSESINLRQRLMGDIVHELGSPLASLQGYLEGMKNGLIAAADRSLLSMLYQKSVTMGRVLKDLNELTKLETRQIPFTVESVAILPWLRRFCQEHRWEMEQAGFSLLYEEEFPPGADPIVKMDAARIEQVLMNLLSNAKKYAPAGDHIRVSIQWEPQGEGKAVRISVTDSGVGIPEEEIPRLFSRFYRGRNGERFSEVGGSGLGLTIAKEIIERHGGLIGVNSRLGEGSTFYFTIPLELPADRALPHQEQLPSHSQS